MRQTEVKRDENSDNGKKGHNKSSTYQHQLPNKQYMMSSLHRN